MIKQWGVGSFARLLVRTGTRLEDNWIMRQVRCVAGPQATAIPSFTTKNELKALYRLASSSPPGARALEVGSYLGASTCFLAAGLAAVNGHLYCVDTWNNETMPGGVRDTFEEFARNIAAVRHLITPVRKRSQDLVPDDLALPLHLVFIDGDHSYEAVRADFALVGPWVTQQGIVSFHDFGRRKHAGVTKVVADALQGMEWAMGGRVGSLIWLIRR
jgi:predicted O-methyltransferase YrrM